MSVRRVLLYFRFLLSPRPARELDEELQFHLAQAIKANSDKGMTPDEARRQALIDFGGVAQTRESSRQQAPGFLLETILQDVRYALRGFRRDPVFAATVLITLALGIGATTAVFSVVDRILFRSLPYAQDDRLVSIGLSQPLEKQEFTLGGFFYDWRDHQQPFTALTFERDIHDCNLTDANPVHLQCAEVAQDFLSTLGVTPVIGRNFLPEEDLPNGPNAAIISDGFWLSRYNRDPGILKKTVSIDDHPYRIVGVLPARFEMPRLQPADIILPAQMDIAAQHTVNSGIGYPMWAFARLKPGVNIEQANAQMQPLYLHTQQWIPKELRNEFHLQIRSIRDRQMQNAYQAAWLLLAGVAAVLLIACANVASLFAARASTRGRELAVRAALGASRARLLRQTMTESLVLALSAAVAGYVLAEILLRTFVAIAPVGIPLLAKARLDLRVSTFTVAVSLLCAVFFGTLSSIEKPRSLASRSNRLNQSKARATLRRTLVAAQIAISLMLLSSAGLLLKSFRNLEQQSLGMQPSNVLTVHVPLSSERYTGQTRIDFYLHAEAALRTLPGVSTVGMSNSLPPDGWHGGMRYADILVMGKAPHPQGLGGTVVTRVVTPGYFRALHIPILEGTGFTDEERTAPGEFIVLSKLLASRLFPNENPTGHRIQFGTFRPYFTPDPTIFTIAGVAADVKNSGLTAPPEQEIYTLRTSRDPDSWNNNHHFFLLESSLPAAVLAPSIRARIAQLDPTVPVEIGSLSQDVSNLSDRPRFETSLIGFFALCGLLMAVIGLYGVIAYVASQRTQEIGVRMALGANRQHILKLIASEGVRVILVGACVGLAASLALSRLLSSQLFNVSPHDPITYLSVTALLAIIALAATLFPALTAMRVDPVVALRTE